MSSLPGAKSAPVDMSGTCDLARPDFLGSHVPALFRTSPTSRERTSCVGGEIVKGDEGPVSGVAQVVCHGVKVVGVRREEGREEDGEVQGEVKRRSRATQRETLIMDGMTDSKDLEPSGM